MSKSQHEWPIYWILSTGIFLEGQSPSGKVTKQSHRLKPDTKTSLKIVFTEGWCARFDSCQVFSLAIAKAFFRQRCLKNFQCQGLTAFRHWGSPLLMHFKPFMLTENNAPREQPLPWQLSDILRVHQKFRHRLYYLIYCRKSIVHHMEIPVRGFICQDKQIHQYYTYEVTITQVTHNQLGKDGLWLQTTLNTAGHIFAIQR